MLLLPSLLQAATAAEHGHPCPADWMAVCPSLPCAPLTTPIPRQEIMGWRARWSTAVEFGEAAVHDPGCMDDCVQRSWTNYINNSALTSIIISTGYNATQIACAAHARGARALVTAFGHSFNTSMLEDKAYTTAWVAKGVKGLRAVTPWADGVSASLLSHCQSFCRHMQVVICTDHV